MCVCARARACIGESQRATYSTSRNGRLLSGRWRLETEWPWAEKEVAHCLIFRIAFNSVCVRACMCVCVCVCARVHAYTHDCINISIIVHVCA